MPHPIYIRELQALVIGMSLLSISFFALFIPGSISFNRTHLVKSFLIYLALLFGVALISAMIGLPMYKTTTIDGNFIDRMFGAQTQGLALFLSKHGLIWFGIISPIMLLSGYYLLKHREV